MVIVFTFNCLHPILFDFRMVAERNRCLAKFSLKDFKPKSRHLNPFISIHLYTHICHPSRPPGSRPPPPHRASTIYTLYHELSTPVCAVSQRPWVWAGDTLWISTMGLVKQPPRSPKAWKRLYVWHSLSPRQADMNWPAASAQPPRLGVRSLWGRRSACDVGQQSLACRSVHISQDSGCPEVLDK